MIFFTGRATSFHEFCLLSPCPVDPNTPAGQGGPQGGEKGCSKIGSKASIFTHFLITDVPRLTPKLQKGVPKQGPMHHFSHTF